MASVAFFYEKAFDRINWLKMLEILKNIGVDWRDRRLINNLYMNQTSAVKIQQEFSEEGEIGRGVRQGYRSWSETRLLHVAATI